MADFGANPQLRHLLSYASRVALPHTCKARFRLAGWLALAGRESNPLDRYERFQFALTIILLSCSPDANGFRFAQPILQPWPANGGLQRNQVPAGELVWDVNCLIS